jgi:hypothetical protein
VLAAQKIGGVGIAWDCLRSQRRPPYAWHRSIWRYESRERESRSMISSSQSADNADRSCRCCIGAILPDTCSSEARNDLPRKDASEELGYGDR